MSCCLCNPKVRNLCLLLFRVILGVIFIYHGWAKLAAMDATVEYLGGVGFPAPVFFTYLVSILELAGGAMLILGFFTKIAATVLGVIMLGALLTIHIRAPWQFMELPLLLFGSCLAVIGAGPGEWSFCKENKCK